VQSTVLPLVSSHGAGASVSWASEGPEASAKRVKIAAVRRVMGGSE